MRVDARKTGEEIMSNGFILHVFDGHFTEHAQCHGACPKKRVDSEEEKLGGVIVW